MNTTRNYVPKRTEDAVLLTEYVRTNDETALAQIVCKYEGLVWNICCRVLHNRHDAEDAFQQTFLLLASKAGRIRKPNSLSSWLYGVAFRTASGIRRHRQRDMLPYETTADHNLPDDVLEFVARKNENELVSAEIMLMKEKHKTPLLMFYFMGDSTAQIAETLGITISAVEGRLRQARRALRTQLRLRGVDFETTCAALIVPVLSISPSLMNATINKIATASASSLAGTIYGLLTGTNQSGAKLMLSKMAVSCSLVVVASLGLLHQEGMQEDAPQVTQVQSEQQQTTESLPIKFVTDDEQDSNEFHSHLRLIHDHIYGVWSTFVHPLVGSRKSHGVETQLLVVEDTDDANPNTFMFKVDTGDEFVEEDWHDANITFTITPQVDDDGVSHIGIPNDDSLPEDAVFHVRWVAAEDQETKRIPYMSKIPYLGHLFENADAAEKPELQLWWSADPAADEENDFVEDEDN